MYKDSITHHLCTSAMLKTLIFTALLAFVHTDDVIQKYEFDNIGQANYSFEFQTGSDKGPASFHRQEGRPEGVIGLIRYKVDDRLWLSINYTADEKGYRPLVKWQFVPKAEGELELRIGGTVLETLLGGNTG